MFIDRNRFQRVQLQAIAAVVVLLGLMYGTPALAESTVAGPTPIPADIQITEKLGTSVPKDLKFTREDGTKTTLKAYLDKGQPIVLVPVYYSCPLLCNITLNRLIDTLKELDWVPGNGYQVVTFSIDPREDHTLAKVKKAAYMETLNRPGSEFGWHFLTAERATIKAVTDAIGFGYRYDEGKMEYLHRAGLIVVNTDGVVSRYFHGAYTPPVQLTLGLIKAADGRLGSFKEKVWASIFEYEKSQKKYILDEDIVLVALGLMVTTLIVLTFVAFRRPRRRAESGT
ncbi:MAG: hypothetical protein CMH52_03890 [Myxococcales bacterium]|nr:hypothetical protein [Myxococcales bacterium]